jgi:hypothetical protein
MVFTLVQPHTRGREPKRFYRPIRDGRVYLYHAPARSGGLTFKKTSRPGGTIDGLYAGAAAYERPGTKTLLSSHTGRTSVLASFPSTSYWATFIWIPPGPIASIFTARHCGAVRILLLAVRLALPGCTLLEPSEERTIQTNQLFNNLFVRKDLRREIHRSLQTEVTLL